MTDATPLVLAQSQRVYSPAERIVLHVGCGAPNPDKLPAAFFPVGDWRELRLDIDPDVDPDIVASITDMQSVMSGSVDAVWSAHNLEHLAAHDVDVALSEFHRVLRPGGFVVLTMPDLQQVAALIADGRLEDPAYQSMLGPIAPLDMLYGFRPAIAKGNAFMGHRTGFIASTLAAHLQRTGFGEIRVERDGKFALWATATRQA